MGYRQKVYPGISLGCFTMELTFYLNILSLLHTKTMSVMMKIRRTANKPITFQSKAR